MVEVDERGKAIFLACPWTVQVRSGNPEPDFPSDCWREVDCGARMRNGGYGDDTVVCEAGHEFGGMERRYAPGGPEWQAEQTERFAETGTVA